MSFFGWMMCAEVRLTGDGKSVDMTQFVIDMAGIKIRICAPTPSTYAYCVRYLTDDSPDFEVSVTEDDVQREIAATSTNALQVNKPYLETVAVYRKIIDKIADYNLFLMHGAAISVDGEAFLFSAPSGTGKTTHIRHWLTNEPKTIVINGDKPLIRVSDDGIYACGTPWCGKERLGTNMAAKLKGLVFLERSEENQIKMISFAQAFPLLLRHVHLPSEPDKAKRTLELISQLAEEISFWQFRCNNFKKDCFQKSHEVLCG